MYRMMFSRNVTFAIGIIALLEPSRTDSQDKVSGSVRKAVNGEGDKSPDVRAGGAENTRSDSKGMTATQISHSCGFDGPCNIIVSRTLDILAEHKIIRATYCDGSSIARYSLMADISKVTLFDLMNYFDYGIRFGEPDIHRDWDKIMLKKPIIENYIEVSVTMKKALTKELQNLPISEILHNESGTMMKINNRQ